MENEKSNLSITRGDYKRFKFQRKNRQKEVITEMPEKMYFTVKQNENEKNVLFRKTLENGITKDAENYYHIEILPSDTDELEFGKYIYDIEIKNDNKPKTIKIGEFNVTLEVTHKENEV